MHTFLALVCMCFLGSFGVGFAAQTSPGGFLAVSEAKMRWPDAKAYCQPKGGKLPLIDAKEKTAADDIRAGSRVDGFGSSATSWPARLRPFVMACVECHISRTPG